jgi:hypothetical protein
MANSKGLQRKTFEKNVQKWSKGQKWSKVVKGWSKCSMDRKDQYIGQAYVITSKSQGSQMLSNGQIGQNM